MKSVYVETSIVSYLTARPSRDLRAAAWQQTTLQWWEQERPKYELFTSELVLAEARGEDADAAGRRIALLDALHIAVASLHKMDYLLTWNCRHIDNAATKPVIRSVCAVVGHTCPEICTPLELLSQEDDDVQR